jgi:hypothetical protein
VVNFFLVSVAVAVHSRAPIPATLRKELPYQAFVNLVLLSAARSWSWSWAGRSCWCCCSCCR